MLRSQSLIAGAILLLGGVFLFPACSIFSGLDAEGPGCANGTKDEGEEGLDCGGICPTKCTGAVCTGGGECASGKCEANVCGAPAGKLCGVGVAAKCNDGDKCELDKDCTSSFCDGSRCATPSNQSHADGKKNGGETGIDCGGSVKTQKPCPDGQGCTDSTDCVGTCNAGTCGPIGPTDSKKNGDETDVDCGGATAPKCINGKGCLTKTDCVDDYCPDATKKCTAPTYDDSVQNGSETDLDCGGTGMGMKKCAETKKCLIDNDCFGACNYKKKCVDIPSCKGRFGSETCGMFETPDDFKNHESCCKSLPVAGFTDADHAGKVVYLDKYEITAGRMRAFLETLGGGVDAAGNAKNADVRAWIAAHPQVRWNAGWSAVLPTANINSSVNYTVAATTVDNMYPGPDRYNTTQKLGDWMDNPGNYAIDVGVFRSLGPPALFPEFSATGTAPDYSVSHALNCTNTHGGGGQSTYWFDAATISAYSGDASVGKYFTKDQMDEKALNCTSIAMFAAFCAWDGGQLATAEAIDYITGNTVSPLYGPANFTQNGKLAIGASNCGGATHNLITFSDGGSYPCSDVYFFPNDMGNDFDASYKVAPGGRVPADAIAQVIGGEPWMDLIGNLEEYVMKAGETSRFDWRGYGHEYGSIQFHRLQMSTPRGKGGAFGARCMRFK